MASCRPHSNRQGLDKDRFGEPRADAETRVADLANHHALLSQQADLLLFAEAHFAQANRDFR